MKRVCELGKIVWLKVDGYVQKFPLRIDEMNCTLENQELQSEHGEC